MLSDDIIIKKTFWWTVLALSLVFVPPLFFVRFLLSPEFARQMADASPSPVRFTYLYLYYFLLMLAGLIILVSRGKINRGNFLFWAGFFLCGFVYIIFASEIKTYGDVGEYIRAAMNINNGQAFHDRYIYPPLWATILQPFALLGYGSTEYVCVAVNFASFLLMFVLTYKLLVRFGFSANLSALLLTLFVIVNTPILRTFYFVQINFHAINLVLLSMLFYPRSRLLSALFLAVGVHLKVSPVIFCLVFLLNRDIKWLIYFTLAMILIVVLTSIVNDFSYYQNFLDNLQRKTSAKGYCLRQNSIDSFVRATSSVFSLNTVYFGYLIVAAKLALLTTSLLVLTRNIRNKTFYSSDAKDNIVMNGFVVISFLMITISPIIWEHHFVFVIPAFLLLAAKISTRRHLIMYVTAWVLIFIVPTFDYYPFSYHRLLGLVICYVLIWQTSTINSGENSFISLVQNRINSFMST